MRLATVLFLMAAGVAAETRDTRLFAAVQTNDLPLLYKLLKPDVEADVRDDAGATPLMHAAAFGSYWAMEALIDFGADVNARTKNRSTALMWAAGDPAKLRLLLDRGADPNLVTKSGTTALLAAVRRGDVAAVRFLIQNGASTRTSSGGERDLLRAAFTSGNWAMLGVLREAGVTAQDPAELGAPGEGMLRDAAIAGYLLNAGFDPQLPAGPVTVLAAAAFGGHRDTVDLLLQRGADPNLRSRNNLTALMMAAAGAAHDASVVRALIGYGADVSAKDDAGWTALDWALTRGETAAAREIRTAGGKPGGRNREVTRQDVFAERPAVTAVKDALGSIDTATVALSGARTIAGLRRLAAWAATGSNAERRAESQPTMLAETVEALALGSCNATFAATAYDLLELAEERAAPSLETSSAAACLAAFQHEDGSWSDTAPLAVHSPVKWTAIMIRVLNRYSPPGRAEETKRRIAKALEYLRSAEARSSEEHAFRLAGLAWAEAPVEDVLAQKRRLIAMQGEDGGWPEAAGMAGDPCATGQALYALRSASHAPSSTEFARARAFLLRTQLRDGSWAARSLPVGFELVSAGAVGLNAVAATTWATLGLTYTF